MLFEEAKSGAWVWQILTKRPENTHHKGKIHCTANLMFYWFGFDQTSRTVVQSTKSNRLRPNKIKVSVFVSFLRTDFTLPTMKLHQSQVVLFVLTKQVYRKTADFCRIWTQIFKVVEGDHTDHWTSTAHIHPCLSQPIRSRYWNIWPLIVMQWNISTVYIIIAAYLRPLFRSFPNNVAAKNCRLKMLSNSWPLDRRLRPINS